MQFKVEKIKHETEKDNLEESVINKHTNKLKINEETKFKEWWICFSLLTALAFITRLSFLDQLSGTTWDEVHFGGFANQYINRTFYHDVHPPLGKILVAGAAYITGYRGNFNFSTGNVYDSSIRYQLIRSEMACMGASMVPITFLTVYELSQSTGAATAAATAVLCDTFIHKLNCLILLDPPMILSIMLCIFAAIKFESQKNKEWSVAWWGWLFATGFILGVVISIKYVGVFTVLLIGLHTVYQLVTIACNPKKSIWLLIPHFMARVLFLIVLPIIIYLSSFLLHFAIVNQSFPYHGSWMQTKLFVTLNNTEYDNKTFPKYVNYGANVTLMASEAPVAYLDSWFDLYPSELTAPCQVVTTMPTRDPEGTVWRMRHVDVTKGIISDGTDPKEPPILVRNGDFIVLTHPESERSLRSHGYRAPYTRRLYQVCLYGDNNEGGPFETWKIIVPGVPEGEALKVFEHDFMLKNYKMNCYLQNSDVKLPTAWTNDGAKEVACTKNVAHSNIRWHINWIESNKTVGNTTAKEHGFNTWQKIVEYHKIMFVSNAGLKPLDTDETLSRSTPWMWPLAFQMQLLASYFMDVSGKNQQIFAVGAFNPLVAYVNIFCAISFAIISLVHFYKIARKIDEPPQSLERRTRCLKVSLWLTLCWAFHYVPFFFMGRILYLHHYCPSFIYSCMVSGTILDYLSCIICETLNTKLKCNSLKPKHLLAIPIFMIAASYLALFPMATYIVGVPFEPVPRLTMFMDHFHLRQPWIEIGYMTNEFLTREKTTRLIPLDENNFENQYINASLYYENHNLNTTQSDPGIKLFPTTSSNYSSLNSPKTEISNDNNVDSQTEAINTKLTEEDENIATNKDEGSRNDETES